MSDFKEIEKLQEQYKTVFKSPEGEAVLESLKKFCKYESSSFDYRDSHLTAFNEGKRHVILKILETLNTDLKKKYKSDLDQINQLDMEY